MDFQIKTDAFSSFLMKCRLGGIIKDLVLFASDEELYAKVTDNSASLYCEIYEKSVKVKEAGSLRIANIDKLLAVVGRSSSEVLRVKSVEGVYVITDGQEAGKFKVDLQQLGDAEFVESYRRIEKSDIKIFDKEALTYVAGKYAFTTGIEVSMEILQVILKDAKAFGFETYRFFEKAGGMNCTIEDPSIGEKFTRRMLIEGKIGSDEIEDTKVGFGFKEMIASLEKNVEKEKQTLKIYFHKVAILITNGSNFFYVLNTVVDSK